MQLLRGLKDHTSRSLKYTLELDSFFVISLSGSKPLDRYAHAVLYTLGILRLVTASWRNAAKNLDLSEICDEIIEYTTLVNEVIVQYIGENDDHDRKMCIKILILCSFLKICKT